MAILLLSGPVCAQTSPYSGPLIGPRQAVSPKMPDSGEYIVAGLSEDEVGITATFTGSDILIYGAVAREAPAAKDNLDVIVVVEGPSEVVTVRRKSRHFGIWINTEGVTVSAVPGFYSVVTTRPLRRILSPSADTRYRISIPMAMRAFGPGQNASDPVAFTEALVRQRIGEGLYRLDEGGVQFAANTLFRADVRLPANLVEGDYKIRIHLLRNGEVIDNHHTAIDVQKVGMERWLYRLALDEPLLYGLLSLLIAMAAGWGASAIFRVIRRN